jgi:hypothetical protein
VTIVVGSWVGGEQRQKIKKEKKKQKRKEELH